MRVDMCVNIPLYTYRYMYIYTHCASEGKSPLAGPHTSAVDLPCKRGLLGKGLKNPDRELLLQLRPATTSVDCHALDKCDDRLSHNHFFQVLDILSSVGHAPLLHHAPLRRASHVFVPCVLALIVHTAIITVIVYSYGHCYHCPYSYCCHL